MSILSSTIATLEAEIQEAQSILSTLRSLNGTAPGTKKTFKAAPAKVFRKKSPGKKWTPAHRANFIKAMKKSKKAKAEATAAA